ncbi:MAG: c-type cytochrome [Gammaproteobacteria bacterium]|nr:c-type cytochrome [Gammaproteobacteria bacterium]MCY3689961.1 c-type cytochrome [Gammaproteobacteria bacterium]MDE0479928.1 c-type cytochrome [Gammaproteobacteria bacterium]
MIRLALICLLCVAPLASAAEREPFDDRYCTTCHGADGRGNEGVQAPRLAGMEPWYLKRQLENYRDGIRGTHPDDIEGVAMQPMAAMLTDESIQDIIEWVGGWNYVPAEHTISGDIDAGRTLYQPCATCHGADAEGNEALGAPALAGQNDWYMVTQIRNFLAGYRGVHPQDVYGAQMRVMTTGLNGENDINNVVAYINSLSD